MIKEGQVYEVTFSKGLKERYAVTAVDEEPDTHIPVCFIISDKGIGQVSYCEEFLEHGKLLAEYRTWQEAVNTRAFNDTRILH